MHYQYWTINMTDIVPVALYGFRILGVGSSGYYVEMPSHPGECCDWDFSEEAREALEAQRSRYTVYETEHHHSEHWHPSIYEGVDLSSVAAEMRRYLTGHERGDKSYEHLNVEVDYGDFVEWVDTVEAAAWGADMLPIQEFTGALNLLSWLHNVKGAAITIKNEDGTTEAIPGDKGIIELAGQWVSYENAKRAKEAREGN